MAWAQSSFRYGLGFRAWARHGQISSFHLHGFCGLFSVIFSCFRSLYSNSHSCMHHSHQERTCIRTSLTRMCVCAENLKQVVAAFEGSHFPSTLKFKHSGSKASKSESHSGSFASPEYWQATATSSGRALAGSIRLSGGMSEPFMSKGMQAGLCAWGELQFRD